MLQAPMKESITKEINLEDLAPQILKLLMQFLYTGEVPPEAWGNDTTTISLLQAAHRFELPRLEQLCAQKLAESPDVETVAAVLQEADAMGIQSLRSVCLEF